MKKTLSLLIAFFLCISMCACGNKLHKQAEQVATKLDGVWVALWETPISEMATIIEFQHLGQGAGKCEYYTVWDGEIVVHYSFGAFQVSYDEDGKISLDFQAKTDEYGNVEKLDSIVQMTLSYTYEDGVLTVMDGDHIFIQTETGSGKIDVDIPDEYEDTVAQETTPSSPETVAEPEYIMSPEDDSLEDRITEIPSVTSASVLKEGSCGESATYTLYDNGVLIVSGSGEVAEPFDKFNDYVKFIKIEEGITAIGDKVFKWLENCLIAELPSTLKTIGISSFENCSSLTTVNLPHGLEHIGDNAFYFSGLTSLEVPGTLLSMGESAFALCDISNLIIQDGVPYISKEAFVSIECEFIVIPGSVKSIGMSAFSSGYYSSENTIKTAILCEGVETLGAGAFDAEIIAIPDSVTKIGILGSTGMDPKTVYCNDGSCAASEFARKADVIVGYDGFIKNYNLEDYT